VPNLWFPLLVGSLWYLAGWLGSSLLFNEGPWPAAIAADLGLQLCVAVALFYALRSRIAFVLLVGILTAFLHLGHAAKLSLLGGPMVPDDLFALHALLLIAPPWQRWLLLGLGAAALGLLLLGIDWRRRRGQLGVALLGLLAGGVVLAGAPLSHWMDQQFGHVEWDQARNYHQRGPGIYTTQELARFFADRRPTPTSAQVARALLLPATLSPAPTAPQGTIRRPRNVHMVVLESFWDANELVAADFSEDPFDPAFRALWQAGGASRALSPVFGGYTANAEFEALCGFPVTEAAVVFERRLTREVPCLPAVLHQAGYQAVASHPNIPVFWNRNNAYRRVGFDRFLAGPAFVYDAGAGGYLADDSFYRQVFAQLGPQLASGQPLFNYMLTLYGHLDYPFSEELPARLEHHSQVAEVGRYASTVRYKSEALMGLLAYLTEFDPDAIVVVFGDHLPVLGERFAGYRESGLLAAERSDFSAEMYRVQAATPLLVIDGRNGPVAVGDLPIYQLPALVMALLGDDRPTLFDYTRPPEGLRLRPLPGMQLLLEEGQSVLCTEAASLEPACGTARQWLRRVELLAADLFSGDQYALPPPAPAEELNLPLAPEPTEAL